MLQETQSAYDKGFGFQQQFKNILDRNFQQERPDAAWCTDITYIWTSEGFVYLASIMDLYSRKIISWTLGETLETKWVLEAVEKAKEQRCVGGRKKSCVCEK